MLRHQFRHPGVWSKGVVEGCGQEWHEQYVKADLSSMISLPVTCKSSLVAYDQSDSSMREEGEAARAPADSTTSEKGVGKSWPSESEGREGGRGMLLQHR